MKYRVRKPVSVWIQHGGAELVGMIPRRKEPIQLWTVLFFRHRQG